MVMSELTGGVDGAGLLVFLGCSMKGRYIDPDQQGDTSWFPKKKVLNHGSIAHGSVVRNNYHREQARDDFLATVDRASAFLSGAETIPFVDSDKAKYLHIGNDPNRKKSARSRKEERARKKEEGAAREEVCVREEENISTN